jgi:RimJ/RimL family protein N-acetyltransferase
MSAPTSIRLLTPRDADALIRLRAEALANDPLSFAASPEDDRAHSADIVRASLADVDEQAIFGGFQDGTLQGMVGLYRDPKLKRRHIAHIWGVYVSPNARGIGLGRAMMLAAIARARQWQGIEQIQLSASTHEPGPVRLYESVGFKTWGIEKQALLNNGRYGDEAHMVLKLRR